VGRTAMGGACARQNHDSWTARVTHFGDQDRPSVGRPQKRWLDDIKPIAGKRWSQTAQDRNAGKRMKEVYVKEDKGGLKKKKKPNKNY